MELTPINGQFFVPDDQNEKRRLWGLVFNEPVSLKHLLDAIIDLPGGKIVNLDHITKDDGEKEISEEGLKKEEKDVDDF